MFQVTFKIVRLVGIAAALVLIASGLSQPLSEALKLNTVFGISIAGYILAAALLIDRPLARLAFYEAAQELDRLDNGKSQADIQ